jgi:hypothetical protein
MRDRLELRTVAIALLASLLLWNLPFGGVLLYPFKLLATWLHEMTHGVMMILTGNGLKSVVIYRDTSGLAHAAGQAGPTALAFIAPAGYMGTSLWGAVLLVATHDAKSARNALLVLAGLLAITAILVIDTPNNETFGLWAVWGMATVIATMAIALPARWRIAVAHFIAAQSCVNAVLDIRVLFRPEQIVNGVPTESDAHTMARTTFGTTDQWALWLWAGIWLAWSLGVLYVALRVSGSRALANVAPFVRSTASPRDGSDRDEHRHSPETAPDRTTRSGPADTAGS